MTRSPFENSKRAVATEDCYYVYRYTSKPVTIHLAEVFSFSCSTVRDSTLGREITRLLPIYSDATSFSLSSRTIGREGANRCTGFVTSAAYDIVSSIWLALGATWYWIGEPALFLPVMVTGTIPFLAWWPMALVFSLTTFASTIYNCKLHRADTLHYSQTSTTATTTPFSTLSINIRTKEKRHFTIGHLM